MAQDKSQPVQASPLESVIIIMSAKDYWILSCFSDFSLVLSCELRTAVPSNYSIEAMEKTNRTLDNLTVTLILK